MDNLIPLYRFFNNLRNNRDFELGLEEYFALLETLQKDLSYLQSPEKLLKLCRLLWLKPGQSERFFDSLFATSFELDELEDDHDTEDFFPDDLEDESMEEEFNEIKDMEDENEQDPEDLTLYLNILRKKKGKKLKTKSIEEIFESLNLDQFDSSTLLNLKQLSQSWRLYKKMVPKTITPDIDLDKTISAITRKGYLETPIFKSSEENTAEVITIIDVGPNMIAFGEVVEMIVSSSTKSTKIPNKVLYFSGVPQSKPSRIASDFVLFEDKGCRTPTSLAKELKSLVMKNREFSILIISDLGAARNHFHFETIDDITLFLKTIRRFTMKVAWLNPLPKDRWQGTSAFIIQELVSMFEIDDQCLEPVINIFRGKDQSKIVHINTLA